MVCNAMSGTAPERLRREGGVLLVLPLILSTSFFLIADIDSPRGGIIHVVPQNLLSLSGTFVTGSQLAAPMRHSAGQGL